MCRMSSSTSQPLSVKNGPACWLTTTQQFIYNIPQRVYSWEYLLMQAAHTCPGIYNYCAVWPPSWVHTWRRNTSELALADTAFLANIGFLFSLQAHAVVLFVWADTQIMGEKEGGNICKVEGQKKKWVHSKSGESTVSWKLMGWRRAGGGGGHTERSRGKWGESLSFLSWASSGMRWAMGGWKEIREGQSRLSDLGLCWQMVGSATLASHSEC